MLLELGKALSFFLSILSLYWVMVSAFFAPGTHWQERLAVCVLRALVAGCICLASGLLFCRRPAVSRKPAPSLASTLPMQLYFWGIAAMAGLFVLSWYIEEYYLPWARKR